MFTALVTFAAAAPPSLDGVYVHAPFVEAPWDHVSRIQGDKLTLYAPAGPRVAGTVEVGTRRLTIVTSQGPRTWTYRVFDGELWLGVAVREGAGWRAELGWDGGDCTPASGCVAWPGGEVTAFGSATQLPDNADPQGTRMPWSASAGPVGVQVGPAPAPGRYWAEGERGITLTERTLDGFVHRSVYLSEVRPDGMMRGVYRLHGKMGHGDGEGELLWFGLPDGRLFVGHQPDCCAWGIPYRVLYEPVVPPLAR